MAKGEPRKKLYELLVQQGRVESDITFDQFESALLSNPEVQKMTKGYLEQEGYDISEFDNLYLKKKSPSTEGSSPQSPASSGKTPLEIVQGSNPATQNRSQVPSVQEPQDSQVLPPRGLDRMQDPLARAMDPLSNNLQNEAPVLSPEEARQRFQILSNLPENPTARAGVLAQAGMTDRATLQQYGLDSETTTERIPVTGFGVSTFYDKTTTAPRVNAGVTGALPRLEDYADPNGDQVFYRQGDQNFTPIPLSKESFQQYLDDAAKAMVPGAPRFSQLSQADEEGNVQFDEIQQTILSELGANYMNEEMAQEVMKELGLDPQQGTAASALNSFLLGGGEMLSNTGTSIARTQTQTPQTLSGLAGGAGVGDVFIPEDNPLYGVSQEEITALRERAVSSLSQALSRNPKLVGSFMFDEVPRVLGGTAAIAASGAGTGGIIPVATGALSNANTQYEAAKEAGADDLRAGMAFIGGGLSGASEALPINRAFARMFGGSGSLLKRIGQNVGEENVQEVFQNAFDDFTAQQLYDANREILENYGWREVGVTSVSAAMFPGVADASLTLLRETNKALQRKAEARVQAAKTEEERKLAEEQQALTEALVAANEAQYQEGVQSAQQSPPQEAQTTPDNELPQERSESQDQQDQQEEGSGVPVQEEQRQQEEEVTQPTQEVAEESVEPQPTVKVSDALSSNAIFERNGKAGIIRMDGQQVVFETDTEIRELGNIEDLSDVDIAEFGISEQPRLDVEVDQDFNVSIQGKRYANLYSDKMAAINRDENGNVVSVTLQAEDGRNRTFRGQNAQEIAYNYTLLDFELNGTDQQLAEIENAIAEEEARQAATSEAPADIGSSQTLTPEEQRQLAEQTVLDRIDQTGTTNPTQDATQERPVLEEPQDGGNQEEGGQESPQLRTQEEEVDGQAPQTEPTGPATQAEVLPETNAYKVVRTNAGLELQPKRKGKVNPSARTKAWERMRERYISDNEAFLQSKPSSIDRHNDPNDSFELTPNEADNMLASQNPGEIAAELLRTPERVPYSERDHKESAIAENMGVLKMSSLEQFGDKNKIGRAIAIGYTYNPKNRPSNTLDQIAEVASEASGLEVTPEDVWEFVQKYPNGPQQFEKQRNPDFDILNNHLAEVLGFEPTPKQRQQLADQYAKRIQDQRVSEADGQAVQADPDPQSITNARLREEVEREPGEYEAVVPAGATNGNLRFTGNLDDFGYHEVENVATGEKGFFPPSLMDGFSAQQQAAVPNQSETAPAAEQQDASQATSNFTESDALNDLYKKAKEKYGEKDGNKYYEAATRLVNPNKNKIVEIRSNGVVVEEDGKFLLKNFTRTDESHKKWELGSLELDVSDQFTPESKQSATPPAQDQSESPQAETAPATPQQQIPVTPYKQGDGGTLGTFKDADGKVYKSLETTKQTQSGRQRTGKTTDEHTILSANQDLPHVPKVGQVVDTSEGKAFEIEELNEVKEGELTLEELQQLQETLSELNARGIEYQDKPLVMRRGDGTIVLADFSSAIQKDGAKEILSNEDSIINILSNEAKEAVNAARKSQKVKRRAPSPQSKYTYLLTQRPPGPGTHPTQNLVGDPKKQSPQKGQFAGRTVWELTYSQPLSPDEIRQSELTPLLDPAIEGTIHEEKFAGKKMFHVVTRVDNDSNTVTIESFNTEESGETVLSTSEYLNEYAGFPESSISSQLFPSTPPSVPTQQQPSPQQPTPPNTPAPPQPTPATPPTPAPNEQQEKDIEKKLKALSDATPKKFDVFEKVLFTSRDGKKHKVNFRGYTLEGKAVIVGSPESKIDQMIVDADQLSSIKDSKKELIKKINWEEANNGKPQNIDKYTIQDLLKIYANHPKWESLTNNEKYELFVLKSALKTFQDYAISEFGADSPSDPLYDKAKKEYNDILSQAVSNSKFLPIISSAYINKKNPDLNKFIDEKINTQQTALDTETDQQQPSPTTATRRYDPSNAEDAKVMARAFDELMAQGDLTLAEAYHRVHKTMSSGPFWKTRIAIQQFQAKAKEGGTPTPYEKRKNAKMAKKIGRRLASRFPGIKVNNYETQQDFLEAYEDVGGRAMQTRGNLYGFFDGTTIHLSPENFSLTTAIHEFGHLWIQLAKIKHKELYEAAAKKVDKTSDLYAEKVAVYGEFDANDQLINEDEVIEEVLVAAMEQGGMEYMERFDPAAQGNIVRKGISHIRNLIEPLRRLLGKVLHTLGFVKRPRIERDLPSMTMEQVAGRFARDMLSGMPIGNVSSEMLDAINNGDLDAEATLIIDNGLLATDIRLSGIKGPRASTMVGRAAQNVRSATAVATDATHSFFTRKFTASGGKGRFIDTANRAREARLNALMGRAADHVIDLRRALKEIPKDQQAAQVILATQSLNQGLLQEGLDPSLAEIIQAIRDDINIYEKVLRSLGYLQDNLAVQFDENLGIIMDPVKAQTVRKVKVDGTGIFRVQIPGQAPQDIEASSANEARKEAARAYKATNKKELPDNVSIEELFNVTIFNEYSHAYVENEVPLSELDQFLPQERQDLVDVEKKLDNAKKGIEKAKKTLDKAEENIKKFEEKLNDLNRIADNREATISRTEEKLSKAKERSENAKTSESKAKADKRVKALEEQLAAQQERQAKTKEKIQEKEQRMAKQKDKAAKAQQRIKDNTTKIKDLSELKERQDRGEREYDTVSGLKKKIGGSFEHTFQEGARPTMDVEFHMNHELLNGMPGQYVNRSYRMFDQKGYFDKIKESEVFKKARDFVRSRAVSPRLRELQIEVLPNRDNFNINFVNEAGNTVYIQGVDEFSLREAIGEEAANQVMKDIRNETQDNTISPDESVFFNKRYRGDNAPKLNGIEFKYSLKQAESELESFLNRDKDVKPSVTKGSKVGKKNLDILKHRKDIPVEIRRVMGDYILEAEETGRQESLELGVMRTMIKQTALIENHKFLESLLEEGKDVIFFRGENNKGKGIYNTKIAAEGDNTYSPLSGWYTTPEIAQALSNIDPRNPEGVARLIQRANYIAKGNMTVYSLASQVRNMWGAQKLAAGQGTLPFANRKDRAALQKALGFDAGGVMISGDVARGNFIGGDKKMRKDTKRRRAAKEYYEFLKARGIVDDNVVNGILLDGMINAQDPTEFNDMRNEFIKGVRESAKNVGEKVRKSYQYVDDAAKIQVFEKELLTLMEAYPDQVVDGRPSEKLIEEAVNKTRSVMPVYSMTPEFIKALNRNPLFGTFVSFQAEMYRNTYNTLLLARDEMRSDNPVIRRRGAERLHARMASFILTPAISTIAGLFLTDWDYEEGEELREATQEVAYPWSKNSILIPTKAPSDDPRFAGKLFSYFDFSYMDPDGGFHKIFTAAMRPGTGWEKTQRAFFEATNPFIGVEIGFSSFVDIVANDKDYVNKLMHDRMRGKYEIVKDGDDLNTTLKKWALYYTEKSLTPGTAQSIMRVGRGFGSQNDDTGNTRYYSWQNELGNVLLGTRRIDQSFPKALENSGRSFQTLLNAARQQADEGNIARANEIGREAFDDMLTKIDAMVKLGYSRKEMFDYNGPLRDARLPKYMIDQLYYRKFLGFDKDGNIQK